MTIAYIIVSYIFMFLFLFCGHHKIGPFKNNFRYIQTLTGGILPDSDDEIVNGFILLFSPCSFLFICIPPVLYFLTIFIFGIFYWISYLLGSLIVKEKNNET